MQDIGLSELAGFMTDFWVFMRKNLQSEDYATIVKEARSLGQKYNAEVHSLPANLINAFLAYLDKEAYEKSGQYPIKRWLNG